MLKKQTGKNKAFFSNLLVTVKEKRKVLSKILPTRIGRLASKTNVKKIGLLTKSNDCDVIDDENTFPS